MSSHHVVTVPPRRSRSKDTPSFTVEMSASKRSRLTAGAAQGNSEGTNKKKAQKTKNSDTTEREFSYWLFKSEPNPRYEKGQDVSYSLDWMEKDNIADWDGVR